MLLLDVRLLLFVLVYYYLYIIQNCYYFNFGKITKTLFSAKLAKDSFLLFRQNWLKYVINNKRTYNKTTEGGRIRLEKDVRFKELFLRRGGSRAGTADYMVHTVSPEKKRKNREKIFILSVVVYYCRRCVSFCLCCVQISFLCTLLS